jgi:hypothetical protein
MLSAEPAMSQLPPVPTRLAARGELSVAVTIHVLGSALPSAQILACNVLVAPVTTSSRSQYEVFALAVNGTDARTIVLPPERLASSSLFWEVCRRTP